MARLDRICFDVGADGRYYVLQFAYWTRPSEHLLAFEPNPKSRVILERKTEVKGLSGRVEVVAAALADGSDEIVLCAPREDRQRLHRVSRLGGPDGSLANDFRLIAVPMISLEDFCDSRQGLTPDRILIDIEGFESAALMGARRLIAMRDEATSA